MTNDFGLKQEAITQIKNVLSRSSKIEKAVIYGSRAKGNFKPGSDIDLTLVGPALTTTDLLEIENHLDDLLLPYKFDLSILHMIESQDLLDHIARLGVDFYTAE